MKENGRATRKTPERVPVHLRYLVGDDDLQHRDARSLL